MQSETPSNTQNCPLQFPLNLSRQRLYSVAWALPVLVIALLGLSQLNTFQVGAYYDDAWYIALATALAEGQGYVRPWTPYLNPETVISPGLPILLTPIRILHSTSFIPMQLLSLISSMITVILCIGLYRKRIGEPLAWLLLLLLAVHVAFVRFSTLVMQEAMYTTLSVLIIVLVDRQSRVKQPSLASYLTIGLLATSAYFVRAWGIALIVALLIWYGSRKNWHGLLATIMPFSLSYYLWSLRNSAFGGVGASYGLGLTTLFPFLQEVTQDLSSKVAAQWFERLPDFIAPLLFGPRTLEFLDVHGLATVSYLAGGFVLIVLLIGYLKQVRKKLSLAEYYVPLYLAILTLAPFDSRYWVPMAPFLILYLGLGIKAIVYEASNRLHIPRVAPVVVSIGLITLIGLHFARDVQAIVNPVRNRIPDVATGPSWLAINTLDDAVIMAPVPRVAYIYSHLITVPYPDGGDGQRYELEPELKKLTETDKLPRFYEALDLFNVDYLLIEPELVSGTPFRWQSYFHDEIVPALERDTDRFQLVYIDESGLVRVYKIQN